MFKKIQWHSAVILFVLLAIASSLVRAEDMPTPSINSLPENGTNALPSPVLPHSEQMPPPPASSDSLPHSLGTLAPGDMLQPPEPSVDNHVAAPAPATGVKYVTGGIGDEESAALKGAEKNYNLRITSAEKSGSYTGAMQVVIVDAKGKEILNVEAEPILFVQLPVGSYILSATVDGHLKKKPITIQARKSTIIHLSWE